LQEFDKVSRRTQDRIVVGMYIRSNSCCQKADWGDSLANEYCFRFLDLAFISFYTVNDRESGAKVFMMTCKEEFVLDASVDSL